MKIAQRSFLVSLCAIGLAISMLSAAEETAPDVSDVAPDWNLAANDGNTYRLSELTKDSAVVVAWYPKAFTRGCTIECRSLKKNGHLIREFEVKYFMASVDTLEEVTGFAEQEAADFPLLADPTKAAARAYGVLHPRGFANRHTVYVGTDGKILAIDRTVNPTTAAEDIAARLAELGIARREQAEDS